MKFQSTLPLTSLKKPSKQTPNKESIFHPQEITFFKTFKESEAYGRMQMARMTPTERLLNLEILRERVRLLSPNKAQTRGSAQLNLSIEFGEKKHL
ncbi:MAG: hypothetical protein CFE21_06035 [Bacteroidetes bacterium B1(2017)]|nr:MAG: hypothetical protein CFE21_06035 [Bacteroidetes bacterium B1(2017)]